MIRHSVAFSALPLHSGRDYRIVKELDLKNEKVKISVNNGTSGELSLELDLKSIETI